ncbi:MAG: hypothetical protein IJU40_07840 [Desulfovibrionaceae bacterium]|nr:hypothetical protein [Desulfovibrionaceae bacterium]
MKLKISLLAFLMTLILAVPALKAAPSVKIGSTTIIKEAINSDIETQLKAASNVKRFVLEEVTDADLAKLVNLFPDMTDLQLDRAKRISNLSPLANLKNLTHLTIR